MNSVYKVRDLMENKGVKKLLYDILYLSHETKELEVIVNKTPFIENYKNNQYEIETEFSNAIENIGEYKYNKDQWDNLNNANKYVIRTFKDPLDIYELLDIHKMLLGSNAHAGVFKTHDNAIAGYSTSLVGDVENDMNQSLAAYYEADKGRLDASLITSILFTLNFLIIHPFQDGNGRMSRMLLHKLIIKSGLSFIKYQSLSQYIHRDKEGYYDSLEKVRRGLLSNPGVFDNDNCIQYVEFVLQIIIEAIGDFKKQLTLYYEIGKDNSKFKDWIIKEVIANKGLKRKYFYNKLSLIMTKDKIYRVISELVDEGALESQGHEIHFSSLSNK